METLNSNASSPLFWIPVVGSSEDTASILVTPSPKRRPCQRCPYRSDMGSPAQSELALEAASERRAAFLEKRKEKLAKGLARVDYTRSLREEQLEHLRAKGRDVQRRLEMASVGRQQRLQHTAEKCSERVAHAKAVVAKRREQENELKDIKMQRYLARLRESEARRTNRLRKRSVTNLNNCLSSSSMPEDKDFVLMDHVHATITIQRWWRAQYIKRASAAFRAAVPRTLVRVLKGQKVEKLTYTLCQSLVALPESTKPTQQLLKELSKSCSDIGSIDTNTTREARLLLSSVVIMLFPNQVLEQHGPAELALIASAERLVGSFAKAVGLRKSNRRTRLLTFTANWLHFRQAFYAWKQQDSARLLASFREHWLQLASLKQTIVSNGSNTPDQTQLTWLPNIERQQEEILRRVRQVAGQTGVTQFVASVAQPIGDAPTTSTATPEAAPPADGGSANGADSSTNSAADSGPTSPGDSAGAGSALPRESDQSGSGAGRGSEQGDAGPSRGGSGGGSGNDREEEDAAASVVEPPSPSPNILAIAQNLELAHEIILDESFCLKKSETQPGTLAAQVQQTMEKAFWDVLQDQLKQDPPVLEQVVALLVEVKEMLVANLPTNRVTSMHMEINAGLDIDLIRQQIEQGALNIKSLALFVLSVMSRLCAPARDAEVQQLKDSLESPDLDIAMTFKGILDLLGLMRLDLANHELRSVRPLLLQHAAQYERAKFGELFPDAPASGIENTVAWLTKAQQNCAIATPDQCRPLTVLQQGFADLVTDAVNAVPETWWLDAERLAGISAQLSCCVLVQTISVLIGGALGPQLAQDAEFMSHLRDTLLILLDNGTMSPAAAEDAKDNLTVQVISSVNEWRERHKLPALSGDVLQNVTRSVAFAFSLENPVRGVLSRRLKVCTRQAIAKPINADLELPPGFQLVEQKLRSILISFARLSAYNQRVFGPVYSSVLQSIFNS